MVYKKYIKRGGKRYGPYLYENERINGKVVTRYVGKGEDSGKSKLFLILISLTFLIVASILLYQGHPELFVGKYSPGPSIDGPTRGGGSLIAGSVAIESSIQNIQESIVSISERIDEISSSIFFVEELDDFSSEAFENFADSQSELTDFRLEMEDYLTMINNFILTDPRNEELQDIKKILEESISEVQGKIDFTKAIIGKMTEDKKDVARELITKEEQRKELETRTREAFADIITPQLCKCTPVGECRLPLQQIAFIIDVYRSGYGLRDVHCTCANGSEYWTQIICKLPNGDDPEPPITGGGGGGSEEPEEEIKVATISEGAKEIIFYQSPPIFPEHCYNLLKDLEFGETFIDCGGDCRSCAVWKEKTFPWFWWILLSLTLMIFVVVNKIPIFLTRRYIEIGNNSLEEKDLQKTNKIYRKMRDSYESLSEKGKKSIRQQSLEFLLVFKKRLIELGFKVEKLKIKKGKLPEINYTSEKFKMANIENTDFERVKKLISNGKNSLDTNKFKEAYATYQISKILYEKLSSRDKNSIKVLCKDYFDKMENKINNKIKNLISELKKGKNINDLNFEGLEKEVLDKVNEEL